MGGQVGVEHGRRYEDRWERQVDWRERAARLAEEVEHARSTRDKTREAAKVTIRNMASALERSQQKNRDLAAEVERLRDVAKRAIYLAEHLFQMVPREVWRDTGGDDGQGHYEGDHRAEQTAAEIAALAARSEDGDAD